MQCGSEAEGLEALDLPQDAGEPVSAVVILDVGWQGLACRHDVPDGHVPPGADAQGALHLATTQNAGVTAWVGDPPRRMTERALS